MLPLINWSPRFCIYDSKGSPYSILSDGGEVDGDEPLGEREPGVLGQCACRQ